MTDNKAPERIIAWINKDGSTQFEGDKLFPPNVAVEYVRADLRPVVKPLVWEDSDFYCESRVFGLIYSANLIQGRWFYSGNAYAELDDAKAAAQADYERRILSALDLAPMTPAQASKRRVRHIKRGTTYEVIGSGKIQTDRPLTDYAEVTVYRGEKDNMLWVRPIDEFEDPDRFEDLPALRAIAEGGA